MGETVGVDGCRFGWIAVAGEDNDVESRLFPSMQSLLAFYREAERVLVDIPIGLPWKECPTRPCDELARRVLKHRHVCVFAAPSRAACSATSKADARRLNLETLGKSLSEQALGICAKVAEVDGLLLSDASARGRVREIHPEVCFWAMNGQQPIDDAKSTRAGVESRLAVLIRRLPRARALVEEVLSAHPRAKVQADDVLDALAAYVTARAASGELRALRGHPDRDQENLPMEMLYVN